MMMAQRLYEAGHITYMRTDSTNLSQDALNMVRGYISDKFGKKYLPDSANQYASKENSQEAHEAIRPSDVNVLAETLKDMEADAQKLYQLIWRQFVACQMTPAQYDSTTLTVAAGDFKTESARSHFTFRRLDKSHARRCARVMKTGRCRWSNRATA
ncbi:DNA topoisomerase I [Klebsiella pneumoniae]|uniref:DNA topoisomerase I n=1 Tax=Klebsiella pneumoniae TaxID=573 RepID=A0A377XSE1_KLEPN|nr:DNA topoisomerase I [Klebsiella pneumoniae]